METATLIHAARPASIVPTAAEQAAVGARLSLRAWDRRKDRRAQAAWPADSNPFLACWSQQNASSGPRLSWAIRLREGDGLIGRLSLRDFHSQSARMGIYLAPPWTNQGYGREALRLLIGLSFGSLGLSHLFVDVAASNHRALRCYLALGFRVAYHEWRAMEAQDEALALLEQPAYADLRPYFDLAGPWAMFLELELRASAWQQEHSA